MYQKKDKGFSQHSSKSGSGDAEEPQVYKAHTQHNEALNNVESSVKATGCWDVPPGTSQEWGSFFLGYLT